MSGRINKRMHGPALVTNVAATKYTVPAGRRAIVRHIHISNPSAAPVDFTLSIGADAAATRLFDGRPIPADDVYDHYCYHVMEAGEIIAALAGTTNILTLTINGDEVILS